MLFQHLSFPKSHLNTNLKKKNVFSFGQLLGKLEQIRLYLKKMLPRLEDRRKYRQEFASSTSFHGVYNIVQTQTRTRRVLWLLVVTGCLGIVIWQICSRFNYYFSWPTTTTVVVQHVENVKFPAVTFCNLNR